jgi:hypothetical protein
VLIVLKVVIVSVVICNNSWRLPRGHNVLPTPAGLDEKKRKAIGFVNTDTQGDSHYNHNRTISWRMAR